MESRKVRIIGSLQPQHKNNPRPCCRGAGKLSLRLTAYALLFKKVPNNMTTNPVAFTFPAVCSTCSSVFPGPRFAISDNVQLIMKGNKAGPCPVCGGTGDIIDGTFSVVGETIRRLTDGLSITDILRLRAVAEAARAQRSDVAAVSDQLAETEALVPFAEWLKNYFKPKSGMDLITYLGFLLTVITSILPMLQSATPTPAPLSEKQIIELTVKAVNASFVQAQQKDERSKVGQPAVRKQQKLGRNTPCPCGSGKKHKHCCL